MPSLEYWASLSITLDGLVQQDQLGRPHGRAATLNKFGPSAGGPGRAHRAHSGVQRGIVAAVERQS